MSPLRYLATLRQEGWPDYTMTVISMSVTDARAKAWHRLTEGMPFVSFGKKDITVKLLGPVVFPNRA